MPINPNIALAVRPVEMADPLAMYGRVAAIQQAQNQNQLAQFQLGAAQREEAATNALSQAYQAAYDPTSGNIDRAKLRQSLATGGFGAKIPTVEKALGEIETQALTRQKLEGELFNTSMSQIRSMWNNVRTVEDALAVHDATHRDPIINKRLTALGVTEPMGRQQILDAAKDPNTFAQFVQRAQLGAEKFMELNKPISVGNSLMTPQGQLVATAPRQSQLLTPEEEKQKTRIALASRPPMQPVAPTVTSIVDPTNPNQMITIDARRYQGGGVGSPGVLGVGGKEPSAALRVNKTEEGKTQLQDDLDNLRASFNRLNELRAIPSTERNPVSNVISATQGSVAGQVFGRAAGTEAQVERDVINSAKQRLLTSIKNATGMSAQQLNSNMELQAMLRSLSDVSLGYEASLRIIDDIENAYVKGAGLTKKTPAGDGGPPRLSPQDQEALNWANANPKDPRAAQIKKQLGVK